MKEKVYMFLKIIFYLFIVISIIVFAMAKDFTKVSFLVVAFVLSLYDKIVENVFKIKITMPLKIAILFLIFIAQCLGSTYGWYGKFFGWDTLTHAISGVIFFYVGLTVLEEMNTRIAKQELHPAIRILFAICFSLSIGVLWEFFEFAADKFFGANMQVTKGFVGQDAVWDTMEDLLAAMMGTILGAGVQTFFIKSKKKRRVK